MVADVAAARRAVRGDATAERLLTSARRPIVLLPRRAGAAGEPPAVAPAVAPGNRQLGVMLPYTPLHHLLLRGSAAPIVLTSGNVSDEPIAYRDADAHAAAGPDRGRVPDARPGRSISGPTTRWSRGFSNRNRCCGGRAATYRSRCGCRHRFRRPVLAVRGRAEEHVLPGHGDQAIPVPSHRGPGERGDAALVHRGHRALPAAVRHRAAGRGARPAPRVPVDQVRRASWPARRASSWSASSTTTPTSRPAWPTTARPGRSSGSRSTAPATARTAPSGAASSWSRSLASVRAGRAPGAGAAAGRRGRHPAAVADGGGLPGRRDRTVAPERWPCAPGTRGQWAPSRPWPHGA